MSVFKYETKGELRNRGTENTEKCLAYTTRQILNSHFKTAALKNMSYSFFFFSSCYGFNDKVDVNNVFKSRLKLTYKCTVFCKPNLEAL